MFKSRQRVHEDVLAGVVWAISGGGLLQIYHIVARAALESGQLIEVMQEAGGRCRPSYVLYPQKRHMSARVRAFVDYLGKALDRPGHPRAAPSMQRQDPRSGVTRREVGARCTVHRRVTTGGIAACE
jgi:hypothetical protein